MHSAAYILDARAGRSVIPDTQYTPTCVIIGTQTAWQPLGSSPPVNSQQWPVYCIIAHTHHQHEKQCKFYCGRHAAGGVMNRLSTAGGQYGVVSPGRLRYANSRPTRMRRDDVRHSYTITRQRWLWETADGQLLHARRAAHHVTEPCTFITITASIASCLLLSAFTSVQLQCLGVCYCSRGHSSTCSLSAAAAAVSSQPHQQYTRLPARQLAPSLASVKHYD